MQKIISLAVLSALLVGCTNSVKNPASSNYGADGFGEEPLMSESMDQVYLLAAAPKYYVGSPYKVEDVQYIPVEDMTYNQTGIAGIVPTELNGTKTSNGEVFDINQMVATSKTLPLPTIVRVTNLDNGQSVVARVNNRGPFVNTRIMDLSPAAARKIGMTGQAKVQVQVLPEQSMVVKNATVGTVAQSMSEPQYTETTVAVTEENVAPVATAGGDYSVQVAALYSEDSANALASKMRTYGNAVVVKESDLYKVRIINLNAKQARGVIDALRSNEGMAPGLLQNGHWINADSI